jgi:hypothetical protein
VESDRHSSRYKNVMRVGGKKSADVIYVAVEAVNHARNILFHYEGISKDTIGMT